MVEQFRDYIKAEVTSILNDAMQTALQKCVLLNKEAEEIPLNLTEASAFIKKSPKSVYRLVSQRAIPFIKQGRTLVFFKSELLQWLKSHRVPPINEMEVNAELSFLAKQKRSRKCRSQ